MYAQKNYDFKYTTILVHKKDKSLMLADMKI